MTASHLVRVEADGDVRIVRLNDPDRRNAMTEAMGDALRAAVVELKADTAARVVIVTGEGSAFSGGGDMDMLRRNTTLPAAEVKERMKAFYPRFLSLRELEIPTIAAINGPAVGAGLCVALACDIRVARTDVKLSVNFGRIGLSPGMAATWLLPRVVGQARALEMLLTGAMLDGTESERIGLVNHAWAAETFWDKTLQLARTIADSAPLANRHAKRLVGENAGRTLAEALDAEAAAQAITFGTADMKEGLASFAEKRKAVFRGE